MLEGSVKLVNHLGLHARAAAQLVRLAGKFRSTIILRRADDTGSYANAKSILSVLALAASFGSTLSLEIDGEDEQEAFDEIASVFANGFGEI